MPPSTSVSRRDFLRTSGTLLAAAGAAPLLRAAPAATPTGSSRRPNLLLIFPDQLRHDWTALTSGCPVRTPNLTRLAEEGARFARASCPSPLCAPSRACLALGQRYGRTGVADNTQLLADGALTFYARLRDAGYRVGSVGKLDLRKAAFDWGADGLHRVGERVYFREWGFTDGFDSECKGDSVKGTKPRANPGPYMRMLADRQDGSLETYLDWVRRRKAVGTLSNYTFTEPMALDDSAYNDNWIGQNGLKVIEAMPRDRPWYLQVNFGCPHPPMDITRRMAEWYRDVDFRGPVASDQLKPDQHRAIRRNYSAMVENIDHWVGRYLDLLERRGELENTIVVFSSDHGEMLGDHNRWSKRAPYRPSVSVPLLVRGPAVRRAVHAGAATTLDLSATFLDYAGVDIPASMDSRSLRAQLEGRPQAGRTHVTSAFGDWRLVDDGRYKLIRGFDPSPAGDGDDNEDLQSKGPRAAAPSNRLILFDLERDPDELNDLAASEPGIVARLQPHLPPA